MSGLSFSLSPLLPAAALLAVLFLIPLAIRLAHRLGFVDEPGGRKQHETIVPPVGGIVIFAVFAGLSCFVDSSFGSSWAYFVALGLILLTGVIDDKNGVPAALKFSVHFLAAFIIVVPGDAQLQTLGNLLGTGELDLGLAVIPFSIACVVYIINAVNMMDGLDGLAGGKSLIIFLWLMAACAIGGWWEPFWWMSIIAGAIVGFLFYNMRHPFRKHAVIFLGDAGSMALGLTIAWFCIHLSQGENPVVAPVSVAWIIALPIIDAFGLLVARLKEGKHPFQPDRRHFHHHFIHAGFRVGQATMTILIWGAILGGIGFWGYKAGIPEPVLGWAWIGLWISHAVLTMKPDRFISAMSRVKRQTPDRL